MTGSFLRTPCGPCSQTTVGPCPARWTCTRRSPDSSRNSLCDMGVAIQRPRRVADLAAHAFAQRGDAGVAGRAGIARIDVEAAVVEILRRLGVELLRLGVVLSDADELQEGAAVGIGLGAEPLDRLPVAVDHR